MKTSNFLILSKVTRPNYNSFIQKSLLVEVVGLITEINYEKSELLQKIRAFRNAFIDFQFNYLPIIGCF